MAEPRGTIDASAINYGTTTHTTRHALASGGALSPCALQVTRDMSLRAVHDHVMGVSVQDGVFVAPGPATYASLIP